MGISFLTKRTKKEKRSSIVSQDDGDENSRTYSSAPTGTKSASAAEHSKSVLSSVGTPSIDKITPDRSHTDDGTPDTAGLTPPTLTSPLLRSCPNTQEATPVRSNVNDILHHHRGGEAEDDGFEMVLSVNHDGNSPTITNSGNLRRYRAKHLHPVDITPKTSSLLTELSQDNDNMARKNLTSLFNCASGDDDDADGEEEDDWDIQLESKNKNGISWDAHFDNSQNNSAVPSVLGGGGGLGNGGVDDRRGFNKKTNETKFLRRLKRRNISKNSTSRQQQQQQQQGWEEDNTNASAPAPVPSSSAVPPVLQPPPPLLDNKNGQGGPSPTPQHPLVPQFINQYDDDGSMPSNLTEPEINAAARRQTPSPRMVTPPSALLGPSARDSNASSSTRMRRYRSLPNRGGVRGIGGGLPPPLVETFSGAEETTAATSTIMTSLVSKVDEDGNTVEDLLSLFRCNEDSIRNTKALAWCGAVATACEQPVCGPLFQSGGGASCLPGLMGKDAVELEKEKEEKFALEFQRNLLQNGIKLIYHESPSHASPSPDWIQSTVKLYVRRGHYNTPESASQSQQHHLQPTLAWATLPVISRMRSLGKTLDSSNTTNDRNWKTLGLLDIHSVLVDDEGEANANSGANTKTSTGFFSVTAANGAVYVFEAPSAESRDYVVRGIKAITSRLVYHMIAGNVDVMNELYQSEETEEDGEMTGELPRLAKPWKAVSRVVHAYLDQ